MKNKYFQIITDYNRFDLKAEALEKIINTHFNQSIVKVKEIKLRAGANPVIRNQGVK